MKEKFILVLKEALEIEDHDVELSDTFRDYDEWDSMGRLSLIAMLDDEYDVQIEDEDFEKLITVKDLWEAVKREVEG